MVTETIESREAVAEPCLDGIVDPVERIVELLCELLPELAARGEEQVDALRALVRREFAGEQLYVTRRRPLRETRAQVLALFNGRNASEVARELGISRATVYRLLKQPGR